MKKRQKTTNMNAHSNPLINPFLSTSPIQFGKVQGLRKKQTGNGIEAFLTDGTTVLGQELLREFLTIKRVMPRKELDLMAGDLVIMHTSGTTAGGDFKILAFTPVTGVFKQLVELCRTTKEFTLEEARRRMANDVMYLDILTFVRFENVDRMVDLARKDAALGRNLNSIRHMAVRLEELIDNPAVGLKLAGELHKAGLVDETGKDIPQVMRPKAKGSNARGNGKSNGPRKGDQRSHKAAAPIRMVASVTAGTPADPASSPLAVLNEVHVEESAPAEAPANAPQEEVVVTA